MSVNFDFALKQAAKISYEGDRQNFLSKIKTYEPITLNAEKVDMLSQKILSLPEKIQFIFFGKYVFNFSFGDITDVYSIDAPEKEFSYYTNFLSSLMNLSENQTISDESLKASSQIALELSQEESETLYNSSKQNIFITLLKRPARLVASILLVFSISFGTAIAVNAEFREQVGNFFYELFDTFGVFQVESNGEVNEFESSSETKDLADYEIGYIPDGFELEGVYPLDYTITYLYTDIADNQITILIHKNDHPNYIDTENITVEEIVINSQLSFYFSKDTKAYLLMHSHDNLIEIIGNIDTDEAINIASKIN